MFMGLIQINLNRGLGTSQEYEVIETWDDKNIYILQGFIKFIF